MVEKKETNERHESAEQKKTLPLPSPIPKHITPAQRMKVGLLGALTLGSSILMWFFFSRLLSLHLMSATRFDILFWGIGTFIAFFLLLAFVGIVALLVHDVLISRTILLLVALGHLVWFHLGWYTFISLALLILGFWYYDRQTKVEESLRIKFSVSKSLRYGLSFVILLVLLAISLTFYGSSVKGQQLAGSSLNPLSEIVGNIANQFLALQVPDYNPKETVDEFLIRTAAKQIKTAAKQETDAHGLSLDNIDLSNPAALLDQISNVDIEGFMSKLPPEIRAQVGNDPEQIREALGAQINGLAEAEFVRTRNKILSDIGVQADGSTPMSEVVKQLVGKKFQEILGPYSFFIPPLLALTIFFTLSIFSFLYAFFIRCFALAIFQILKASRFVELRAVDAKVEVATLGE